MMLIKYAATIYACLFLVAVIAGKVTDDSLLIIIGLVAVVMVLPDVLKEWVER